MTADEIMEAIEEMDNVERIKLLNKLFENYFSRPPKEQIIKRNRKCFGAKKMSKTGKR